MKIVEGLPPRQHYGSVALDLEIFNGDRRRLHRPIGDFACLGINDGKTTWLVTKARDVEKALGRVQRTRWYCHNGSFDLRHLRRWADVPRRSGELYRDTQLVERILWGGFYDSFALADLSRRYLRQRLDKDTRDEFIKGSVLTEEMKAYAANDPFVTHKIGVIQDKLLAKDPPSEHVWNNIDGPAFWASLVFKGIHLNRKKWQALADKWQSIADEIQAKLPFNLNSPSQVKAALADARIYVESTKEDFLAPFKGNKLVDMILSYREAAKRSSTYGENLFEFLEADKRIYSEFVMVGAETGRTSCNGPNLQNQPREPEYRACFEAMIGHLLGIFDYGQQEMRLSAQLTQDPGLLHAFEIGEDIYTYIIRKVRHNPSIKKSDKAERRLGKTVGLSLNYGLTEYGMVEKVPGMTLSEAVLLIQEYYREFPKNKEYLDWVWYQGQQDGFVRSPGGRRIWLNIYGRGGRNSAYNGPMQAGGADMIKLAIGKLYERYTDADFPVIGPIHDELLVEARRDKIKQVANDVDECMTAAFTELCPTVSTKGLIDGHIGKTWADKG